MKQYIRLDEKKNVIYGFSDNFAFKNDVLEGDIEYGEPVEGHFALDGVINQSLQSAEGVYLYKYIAKKVVAKTEAEIQKEISELPIPEPSLTVAEVQEEVKILEQTVVHHGEILDVMLPPEEVTNE